MSKQAMYKRVLLKLSGEALSGDTSSGVAPKVLDKLANEIGALIKLNIQVGIVIGGGNLFRGKILSAAGFDRITADHMGMLATVMNALAMRDAFERAGLAALVMSAIPISGIVDQYDRRKAITYIQQGNIVIFAGGTGNPLVTTDSAASLRAIEIGADVLIKATNVDGIYAEDPAIAPNAKRYNKITYKEALTKELGVMDLTAFTMCRDHNMRICVFNLNKADALMRVAIGEEEGTLVAPGGQ